MSFRNAALLAAAGILLADLPTWVSTIEAGSRLEEIFFANPSWRKPPKETRPLLDAQIGQSPNARLYYLRAREAEALLDFPAAEADWAKYVELAPEKVTAWREKAAFHERRVEPVKQVAALLEAAKVPSAGFDIYREASKQRAWLALEDALRAANDHLLDPGGIWSAWEARYPKEPAVYTRLMNHQLDRKQWNEASDTISRYSRAVALDETELLGLRATVERRRGNITAARDLYEKAYKPDWPDALLRDYFATNPPLADATRRFHHFRLAGNLPAAKRELHTFTGDRLVLARLHEQVDNVQQAAVLYHGLAASNEQAHAALIELLLRQAAQPFAFGGGDLGFYRDIATLDSGPGFWNGLVSLLLNGQNPAAELSGREQKSTAYFHRATAAALLRSFDTRFPNSSRRAGLHARVMEASAIHAEADRVIRLGQTFLTSFPAAAERTQVVLLTADAHARLNQTEQEFALYDSVLDELARKAGRVPIGEAGQGTVARSPEYTRVLDRYIARLAATRQPARALALYNREIERNPDDPGLYERLAGFLEQSRMAAEIETAYRKAMQQFNDKTWAHKLARFLVRQKMNAKFEELSRQVTGSFSGTELESFLRAGAEAGSLDPVLYRQVNLYAHQRFPHHVPFVRNLISAYDNRATSNPAERDRLLRAYWMFDEGLRNRFFQQLASSGRLDAEIAALEAQTALSSVRFVAEAEEWRSHFEKSAPLFKTLAAAFPADAGFAGRAASTYRSLAAWDAKHLDDAIALEEQLARAHPGMSAIWTRLGEMQADLERYDKAAAYWARIPGNRPGVAASYVEAATLHWDYYRYADALRLLEQGRTRLANPALFAYEAGAIRENQGDIAAAAREYVSGALADGPESSSRARLLRVASRPQWRGPIGNALNAARDTMTLRVALLEARADRNALESFLLQAVGGADAESVAALKEHGRRNGMLAVERRALERELELAATPSQRMQVLAARMRLEEGAGNSQAAERAVEAMLRENSRSLGAIRTAANFYSRTGAKSKAAETLFAASGQAYPELKRQLHLEALRKWLDADALARVHSETDALLRVNALDAAALALKAEAFSRANDQQSLAALYAAAVKQPGQSPAAIVVHRRNWIAALIRRNDHAAAADQYIELLKQYPEDTALLAEAARHASEQNQRPRLTGFFAKAETDSPRDARWPMVRARLEESFGEYDAALAAWGRAVTLRPERAEFLASRATLEERLGRFDLAAASYRKLYDLTYKNPDWLVRGATVLARQGKSTECVAWLREGLISNRPPSANQQFRAAEHLLDWGLVAEANAMYLDGARIATPESDLYQGARLAARLAVLQRDFNPKVAELERHVALPARAAWRSDWLRTAAQTARNYLTPEEKLTFGTWLESQRAAGVSPEALAAAAQQAGLTDIAARALQQGAMAKPGSPEANQLLSQLERLQYQRQLFGEFGRQVEAYHRVHPNNEDKAALLHRARRAYFLGGDEASELRVLATLQSAGALGGDLAARFFELRSRRTPIVLSAAQRADESFLDDFANSALRLERTAAFNQLVSGRRSPQWQNAARALGGLYFRENSPAVRKAFLDVVGPDRIGEKLALTGNRDAQLAGSAWFYYAGRYGAWLQLAGDAASPHYLVASIESRSNSAAAYVDLGEESSGPTAENAFRAALTLDPHHPIAHARLAARAQSRADRIAGWRRTFAELRWWHENRRVPEWYWDEVKAALRNARDLRGDLQDDAGQLLRSYVKRNGAYRAEELLEAAYGFAASPAEGVKWISEIARSAPDPAQFLGQLNEATSWMDVNGREALLALRVQWSEERYQRAIGDEREFLKGQLDEARFRYLRFLAGANRIEAGAILIEALRANPDYQFHSEFLEFRLLLAAKRNQLESALAAAPENAEMLRASSSGLRRHGLIPAARAVLRRAYEIEWRNGNTDSAVIGMAALHLESNEPLRALPLLQRYVMQAPIPYSRHAEAAGLLDRSGQSAEAARLWSALVAAEPWNREARAAQGLSRRDSSLDQVVADRFARYAIRVRVAKWIGENAARSLSAGSAELNLLAAGIKATTNVDFPLFVDARMAAAAAGADRVRLYRAVLGIEPDNFAAFRGLFRVLASANRHREAVAMTEDQAHYLSEEEDRRRLGVAHFRLGDWQRAVTYLEPLDDPLAASARAQEARSRANEQRRPRIGPELEQPGLVKPRLTGGAQ